MEHKLLQPILYNPERKLSFKIFNNSSKIGALYLEFFFAIQQLITLIVSSSHHNHTAIREVEIET